jgi:phospholipase/carboxylesterase
MPFAARRTPRILASAVLALLLASCKAPNVSDSARRSVSAAPATAPAPSRSLAFEFVELVSAGARDDERLPLVVALHGLGDRPENFAQLFDGFEHRARFVAPHSSTEYGGGFSWFDFRRGDPDFSAPGIARAADALSDFIVALEQKRPTAGKPIVTGFSQGGALSFAIAARHPGVVAFAIPMSGWLPPSLVPEARPEGPLPTVVVLHGTADPLIPIERGQAAVAALTKIGFSAELRPFDGERHSISPEARATLFSLLENAILRP